MVQHKYIVILIPWEKFVPVQLYDYVTSLELVLFIATTMGKFGRHAKKPIIEDEEEVYHVEVITKARVAPVSDSSSEDEPESSVSGILRKKKKDKTHSQARWEYWVKWAGYDTDANSWEPEKNVADCQRLLSSFWDHIGMDNEDYPVGYEVHAKESWIRKEKKFFAREYKGLQEQRKKEVKKSGSTPTRSSTTSSSAKGKQKAADVGGMTARFDKRPDGSSDRTHLIVGLRRRSTSVPSHRSCQEKIRQFRRRI
jgi:hypothetical protein